MDDVAFKTVEWVGPTERNSRSFRDRCNVFSDTRDVAQVERAEAKLKKRELQPARTEG